MFRKIIKKLNNFKFTSLLAMIISAVTGIYAICSFAFFSLAGEVISTRPYVRAVGFYYQESGGILSFLVFLSFFFSLVFSIVVCYGSFPFIMNKEKMVPRKNNLLIGFIAGVFELMLVALMIALLGEHPKTMVGIIISIPFGILSAIGCLLYLIPWLRCEFYMPEIKR